MTFSTALAVPGEAGRPGEETKVSGLEVLDEMMSRIEKKKLKERSKPGKGALKRYLELWLLAVSCFNTEPSAMTAQQVKEQDTEWTAAIEMERDNPR